MCQALFLSGCSSCKLDFGLEISAEPLLFRLYLKFSLFASEMISVSLSDVEYMRYGVCGMQLSVWLAASDTFALPESRHAFDWRPHFGF